MIYLNIPFPYFLKAIYAADKAAEASAAKSDPGFLAVIL